MQSIRRISKFGQRSQLRHFFKLTYCQQKYFSYQRFLCNESHNQSTRESALFSKREADMNLRNIPVELDLDIAERLKVKDQLKSEIMLRNIHCIDLDQLEKDFIRLTEIEHIMSDLESQKAENGKVVQDLKKSQSLMPKVSDKENLQGKISELMKKGKIIKEKIKDLLPEERETEYRVMMTALNLPNRLHRNTPLSEDRIVDSSGTENSFPATVSHVQIAEEFNLIRFSNIGIKAYYFKDTLALLEQALTSYFTNRLREGGFVQLSCPEFFREFIVEGCGINPDNPEEILKLKSKPDDPIEYFLAGVSIMSFVAYLAKNSIKSDSLPLKYFACGRSYTPETANDLPGLFSAKQTVKTNIFGVVRNSDDCEVMYKSVQENLWELYTQFGIPCRLVTVAPPALHNSEELRVELQMWARSIQKYIKVASVSIVSDYISRRLMIRPEKSSLPVYMVHCEALDVTRLVAILLEYGTLHKTSYSLPDLDFLDGCEIQTKNKNDQ